MRNILSVFGAGKQLYSHGASTASILQLAANTTIPIGKLLGNQKISNFYVYCLGIDDIKSVKKLEDLAVDFFNRFVRKTISRGEQCPKTGLVVTANCSFSDKQRLVYQP